MNLSIALVLLAATELPIYQNFMRKAADDPKSAVIEAITQLQACEPQKPKPECLQTLLFLLDQKAPELPDTWKHIPVGEDLDPVLALRLRYHQEPEKDKTKTQTSYQQQAQKLGDTRFAVRLLSDRAFQAYNEGQMKESLTLSQQAFKILESQVPADDVQRLDLKGKLAMYLEYTGEREKSAEYFREVIEDYKKSGLRTGLAESYFNYGLLMNHNNHYPEAEELFKKVADIADDLNADVYRGQALKGLGFTQWRQRHYDEAAKSYEQAIGLMQSGRDDPVSIADTYKLLGSTYARQKKWDKALSTFDIAARNEVAMGDKVWEVGLQKGRVEALAGLGKMAEALRVSQDVIGLLENQMIDDREAEMNKLKVSMGLQMEEQKNASLQQRLSDVTLFAGLVILMLVLILVLMQRARKNRERMHRILQHIEEGILTIGRGMRVEADLSPYLSRLMGITDLKQDSFQLLLNTSNLKSDEKATIRAALEASMGEEKLTWDLNANQLPAEISIQSGSRALSLDWLPLFDKRQRIQSVLITVRDITIRKKMQTEITEAQESQQRMLEVLNADPHSLDSFCRESKTILQNIRAKLNTELPVAFGQLHTLKGLSRSLGFKALSSLTHELEDQLDLKQQLIKEPAPLLLEKLENLVKIYSDIGTRLQREPVSDQSLMAITAAHFMPVRRTLLDAGFSQVSIEFHDHVRDWPAAWLDTVRLALLHGLANSSDHGFILPKNRGESISHEPIFTIHARESIEGLLFEILDNGAGLNLQQLQNLADKNSWQPKGDETLGDIVFLDGISTADKVSRSSGRGVGLSALRHAAQALQGEVRFRKNPSGSGSSLLVRIPYPNWRGVPMAVHS